MAFGFVLANPPKTRRRRHKAKRRFGARRRNSWFGQTKRHRRAARKGIRRHARRSPRRARRSSRRRHTARKRNGRRRRNYGGIIPFANPGRRRRRKHAKRSHSRRRRNPGRSYGGGMGALALPQIIPFKVPLPGILGTVANGIVQSAGYGACFIGGFALSGIVVDAVLPVNRWTKYDRSLAYGAIAGATGFVVARIARVLKLQNPGLIAAIAAAGPAARSFGGLLYEWFGTSSNDTLARFGIMGKGLMDFLQVGDGVSDFIQEGSMGVGNDETFGLGGENEETFSLADEDGSDEMAEGGVEDSAELAVF